MKEKCDDILLKNEDEIKENQENNVDAEKYNVLIETNNETVARRAKLVRQMDGLLKPGGNTSLYQELHRAEGLIARARAQWQEEQIRSRESSPQKTGHEDEPQQGAMGPSAIDENRPVA